ncbi:alpha-ribazole phosphatase family protein [Allohahella marinimesophila]|uniref:Alpha-ribazole phosphatase n=1 Tax=Allohahella marinimesophila TaxID=1054972 RepID=A0ABP7PD49_9GAMM
MIVLVRHTRVAVPPGTIYGHSDVALADSFDSEAEEVLQRLGTLLNEQACSDSGLQVRIHSSPLSRCMRLARHIEAGLGPSHRHMLTIRRPITVDTRLREMNFGDWEKKTWTAISEIGGKLWGERWETQATPNGEGFPQLYERARAFHEDLTLAKEGDDLPSVDIVVTHSGVIRCLHAHVQGLPRREAFSLSPDFGSVRRLQPPQH